MPASAHSASAASSARFSTSGSPTAQPRCADHAPRVPRSRPAAPPDTPAASSARPGPGHEVGTFSLGPARHPTSRPAPATVRPLLAVRRDLGASAPPDPGWAPAATLSYVAATDRPLAPTTIDLRNHPSISLSTTMELTAAQTAGVAADVADDATPMIRVLGLVSVAGAHGGWDCRGKGSAWDSFPEGFSRFRPE